MNLTTNQIVAIVITILSVLSGATAQLTKLFGPDTASYIVSSCNLLTAIISGALVQMTSQGSQVKSVLAMPGVEKININSAANQTLAAIAVDPSVDKISPTPSSQESVEATAKGA